MVPFQGGGFANWHEVKGLRRYKRDMSLNLIWFGPPILGAVVSMGLPLTSFILPVAWQFLGMNPKYVPSYAIPTTHEHPAFVQHKKPTFKSASELVKAYDEAIIYSSKTSKELLKTWKMVHDLVTATPTNSSGDIRPLIEEVRVVLRFLPLLQTLLEKVMPLQNMDAKTLRNAVNVIHGRHFLPIRNDRYTRSAANLRLIKSSNEILLNDMYLFDPNLTIDFVDVHEIICHRGNHFYILMRF